MSMASEYLAYYRIGCLLIYWLVNDNCFPFRDPLPGTLSGNHLAKHLSANLEQIGFGVEFPENPSRWPIGAL